jgi:phosphate starvation-inducible PhoH-like protein
MKSKPDDWQAPNDDNKRLSNLCGPLDQNLQRIEQALNVAISRRGARLQIQGDKQASQQAIALINQLFERCDKPLELDELELSLVEIRQSNTSSVRSIRRTQAAALLSADSTQPDEPDDMPTLKTRRTDLQARTPRQRDYIRTILSHDLTFGIGPAGTGKTYLAVACAADALERDAVRKIILTRPAVEAGERLGFLPGDLTQKIDPYLRPLYDALYDLIGYERVQKMFDKNMIEIAPLAYMRGRTLNHAFVILDEAQNTTPEQMKMFLTRIGFGSKAVITGDVTQIDLPRGQRSGLVHAQRVLKDVNDIGISEFFSSDVVRHPLVAKIVDAYEKHEKANPSDNPDRR